jgi:hypothetical protein
VPKALPTEHLFIDGDHHDPLFGQVATESHGFAVARHCAPSAQDRPRLDRVRLVFTYNGNRLANVFIR